MADDILVNLKVVPDVQNAQQSVKRELDNLDARMSSINKKQVDGVNQATRARLDGIRREGDALAQLEQRKRQMASETSRQAIQLDKQFQLQTGGSFSGNNITLNTGGGGAALTAAAAAAGVSASRGRNVSLTPASKSIKETRDIQSIIAAARGGRIQHSDWEDYKTQRNQKWSLRSEKQSYVKNPQILDMFLSFGDPKYGDPKTPKEMFQKLDRQISVAQEDQRQIVKRHSDIILQNNRKNDVILNKSQLGRIGKYGQVGVQGAVGSQVIPFIEEETGFDITKYVTGGVGGVAIGGNIGGPVGAAIGGVVGVLIAALNDLTKAVLSRTKEEDYYAAKEKSEQKQEDDQNDRRHLLMYEFAGLEEGTQVSRMKDPKKLLSAKQGRTDLENLSDEDLDHLLEGVDIGSNRKLYKLLQMEKKASEGMSEGELQTYNSTAQAEAQRYARNERIAAYKQSTTPFDVEGSAQKYGYQGISNNIDWVPELIKKIEAGLDKLEDDDALTGALEDIAGFRSFFNKSLKAPDQIEKQRAKLFGGQSDDSLVQIGAAEAVTGGGMAQAIQDSNMSILKETAKTNEILQVQYKTALDQYNLLQKQERTQILG